MKRCGLVLACAVLLLGGCRGSVVGEWHMVKSVPNREMFAIDNVHFARDGSYTAATTLDGHSAQESGTYDFNGYKLTFRPSGGGQRAYNSVLKLNRLEILDGKRQVVLEKGAK